MRKVVKDDNITLLFPDMIDEDNKAVSEKWFDEYDKRAKEFINLNEKEVYTKDDLIDAFMTGASTSQRLVLNHYCSKLETLKTFNQVKKSIDDFQTRYNNGFYK